MKKITVLVLCCLAAGVSAAVQLVDNGKAVAEIVIDAKAGPGVKLAAKELQSHLQKISGAKLSIVNKADGKFKNRVIIGPGMAKQYGVDVSKLIPGGYKIVTKDNNTLILAGRDRHLAPIPRDWTSMSKRKTVQANWEKRTGKKWKKPQGLTDPRNFNKNFGFYDYDAVGSLYAVYEFLEQLGVRWYHPGDVGTVIPKNTSIIGKNQNLTKVPHFPYRYFHCTGLAANDDSFLWLKRMKMGKDRYYWSNHNVKDIIELQHKEHPEFIAMQNGKRAFSGCKGIGLPNLLNPGLRREAVEFMDFMFTNYPELKQGSLGMPDGYTHIGDDAAKWDTEKERGRSGKMSDYVWDFWNAVAKEVYKKHPDKYIAVLAYVTYLLPPEKIAKIPPNVIVTFIHNLGMYGPIPHAHKKYMKARKSWMKKLSPGRLIVWEHYLFHEPKRNFPPIPTAFFKILQKDLQKLDGFSLGQFSEVSFSGGGKTPRLMSFLGLNHLHYYVVNKLFWNPKLDMEALIDEYCKLYYGPANKEMRELFNHAETVWMRPESRSITPTSGFFKAADVTRFFALLKDAKAKVKPDSIYAKRIALLEKEMLPMKKIFSGLKRTGPTLRGRSLLNSEVKLDGDLTKPIWNNRTTRFYPLVDLVTGERPRKNRAEAAFLMLKDKSALLIGIRCGEHKMKQLISKTTRNDSIDIFSDDTVEVYLESPERSYFKIAVNPNGTVYDESQDSEIVARDTLPLLWNPGIRTAVKKGKDYWSVEILIPTKDLGSKGPTKLYPWGINVCRGRMAGGKYDLSAISPTGKFGFKVLTKLGKLNITGRIVLNSPPKRK